MVSELIEWIDGEIADTAEALNDEATLAVIALFMVAVWARVMFIKRRRGRPERPSSAVSEPGGLDLTTQLARLQGLHNERALDDDEYKAAKAKLLSDDGT